MGRSKEMGKPVDELTFDELKRERVRSDCLAALYRPKIAKGIRKRLMKIEQRLSELDQTSEEPEIR
jgi:hypothetical protein